MMVGHAGYIQGRERNPASLIVNGEDALPHDHPVGESDSPHVSLDFPADQHGREQHGRVAHAPKRCPGLVDANLYRNFVVNRCHQ